MPQVQQTWALRESKLSTAASAFVAGLRTGREDLSKRSDPTVLTKQPLPRPANDHPDNDLSWSEPPWRDYYQLGRWSMLVWLQTTLAQDAQRWVQYQDVLRRLRIAFMQHAATDVAAGQVIAKLDQIQMGLVEIATQDNDHAIDDLNRVMRLTVHQLATLPR